MNKILFSVAACFAITAGLPFAAYAQQDNGQPPRDSGGRGFGGPPGEGRGPGRGGPDMMRMIPVMAALDADGNGVISSAEIAGAVAALKALDKNNDGQLDGEELRPAFGGPGGRGPGGFGGPGEPGGGRDGGQGGGAAMVTRLMSLNKNGDGQLSKEEMGDRLAGLFTRADADKNGFVTKVEIEGMSRPENRRGQGGVDRQRRPASE